MVGSQFACGLTLCARQEGVRHNLMAGEHAIVVGALLGEVGAHA